MSSLSDRIIYDQIMEDFNNFYCINDDEEILEESNSNIEMTKVFFNMKKEYRKEMKYFIKNAKSKEYDKCRKGIGNMRAIIDEAEYEIKKLDQDQFDICFGTIVSFVYIIIITLLPLAESLIGAKLADKISNTNFGKKKIVSAITSLFGMTKLGKILAIAESAWNLVSSIYKLRRQMQIEYGNAKTKEEKKKCSNLYRLQLISKLHDMKDSLNDFKAIINYREEVEKDKNIKNTK